MARPISPIAAQTGQSVKAKASMRCSCDKRLTGMVAKLNPTCPVHGHGRPPGTGK